MLEIVGYIASLFIGIALSLIGGGGSILTVPVLVYLFSINAITATGYSLFIVGITSAISSISYFKQGLVNVKTAIVFGIPSIVAVFATRAYIMPMIPERIFSIGDFHLSKAAFILIVFALLMVAASNSMIKKSTHTEDINTQKQKFNYPVILAEGITVGVLTGLVGAGGGFLIIPALVVLSKLPMKEAIGTSLVIIAAKSLIGFLGEASETTIDWLLLLKISAFALIGIFVGIAISKNVNGNKLKPAFGWFTLVMGLYILVKETLF